MQLSSLNVRALCEAIQVTGHDREQFERLAGLPRAWLDGPYLWVDAEEFGRLIELALDFTRDDAFGLHWARVPYQQYDLGRSALYAGSLRDALQLVCEFHALVASEPALYVVERSDALSIAVHPALRSPRGQRMLDDFALSAIQRLLQAFQAETRIECARFRSPAPRYAAEYSAHFRCPVLFGQPTTELRLRHGALDTANATAYPELCGELRKLSQRLLPAPDAPSSVVESAQRVIARALPRRIQLGEVAKVLGCSDRTLRRRLEAEGTTFFALLQQLQLERSRHLLATSALPVKQVAAEAGFQSTTAFNRAFRRRTGHAPNAFRAARNAHKQLAAEE
jgi:AraC-like DNA-binding protein